MTTRDELIDVVRELVFLSPDGSAELADALIVARDILTRTLDGAPTGWACEATNSGVPNYLRCGRDLYRYASPAGLIDQCAAGHMAQVEAQDG